MDHYSMCGVIIAYGLRGTIPRVGQGAQQGPDLFIILCHFSVFRQRYKVIDMYRCFCSVYRQRTHAHNLTYRPQQPLRAALPGHNATRS
jgi:hypothetical protein